MIICTGGMSVDPDDVTPTAIKDCGGELVTYGSPILPGAMFLLAYIMTFQYLEYQVVQCILREQCWI